MSYSPRWVAITANYYEHPKFGGVKFMPEDRQWWSYPISSGWMPRGPFDTFEDATAFAEVPAEHTQDPDGEWSRVGGGCVCLLCGKTFYRHPLDGPEGYDGKFLNRICDGRLVKL
jgi:hypothetical protein